MRHIDIPWTDMENNLKEHDAILPEETISNITLMRPKTLRVYLERPVSKPKIVEAKITASIEEV